MNKYIENTLHILNEEVLNEFVIKDNIDGDTWVKLAKKYLINRYQYTPVPAEKMKVSLMHKKVYCGALKYLVNRKTILFCGKIKMDGQWHYIVATNHEDASDSSTYGAIVITPGQFVGTDFDLEFTLQHEAGHETLVPSTSIEESGEKIPSSLDTIGYDKAKNALKWKRKIKFIDNLISDRKFGRFIANNPVRKLDNKFDAFCTGSKPNKNMTEEEKKRDSNFRKALDLSAKYECDHANAYEMEADSYGITHVSPQYIKILMDRGEEPMAKALNGMYNTRGIRIDSKGIHFDYKKVNPNKVFKYKNDRYPLREALLGKFGSDIKKEAETYFRKTINSTLEDIKYRITCARKSDKDAYKSINPRKVDRKYPEPEDKTSPERKARQEEIARRSAEGYRRREELAKSIKEKENKK